MLVNLTSQTMPSGVDLQSTAAVWQGPVVRNEETGVYRFGVVVVTRFCLQTVNAFLGPNLKSQHVK